jgi:hypothetical protein
MSCRWNRVAANAASTQNVRMAVERVIVDVDRNAVVASGLWPFSVTVGEASYEFVRTFKNSANCVRASGTYAAQRLAQEVAERFLTFFEQEAQGYTADQAAFRFSWNHGHGIWAAGGRLHP